MILDAAGRYGSDLSQSFMVGDRCARCRLRGQCRRAHGVIDRGVKERDPDHAPDFTTYSLAGAVEWILG
jgi:histidinol phosphatase-like enzyme